MAGRSLSLRRKRSLRIYNQVYYALRHRLTHQKKETGRRFKLNAPQRKRLIQWVIASRKNKTFRGSRSLSFSSLVAEGVLYVPHSERKALDDMLRDRNRSFLKRMLPLTLFTTFQLRYGSSLFTSAMMSILSQPQSKAALDSLEREHRHRPVEVVAETLETPSLDNRSYRVVHLPNQLEVVLVHDADTDKASAVMDVNVGNFSDEDDFQGMAHAVENEPLAYILGADS